MKAHGFRVFFTPLLEVLFTFPSRYLCAIGLSVVFSLAGWSPLVPAEFLVLRGTQVPPDGQICISRTGLSPCLATLSCVFRYASLSALPAVLQPRALPETTPVWAGARSLATTCAIVLYFLFLRVLRCFSSPGPLTAAFRSLSRPSSPPRATGIPRAPLFAFFLPLKPRAARRAPLARRPMGARPLHT